MDPCDEDEDEDDFFAVFWTVSARKNFEKRDALTSSLFSFSLPVQDFSLHCRHHALDQNLTWVPVRNLQVGCLQGLVAHSFALLLMFFVSFCQRLLSSIRLSLTLAFVARLHWL